MKVFFRLALMDAMALAQRFVVAFERVGLNQLRAVRLNAQLAFAAGISGDDDLNGHIHHCPEHRVCNARVARA